jgi:hypothetical protein
MMGVARPRSLSAEQDAEAFAVEKVAEFNGRKREAGADSGDVGPSRDPRRLVAGL